MEQHADRALGALQDPGDLGGAHLVDEPEHDRPASVAWKPTHGRPRGRRFGAGDGTTLHVLRAGHARCCLEGRGRATSQGPAMVCDDVPGDPEKPDAERRGLGGRVVGRRFTEARQRAKREHERPFRHVLRLVVIAELVVGKVVDLGEILPIERVEARWVGLGGSHERPVRVERDHPPGRADRDMFPLPSKHRARPSVTRGPRGSRSFRRLRRPGRLRPAVRPSPPGPAVRPPPAGSA